MPLVEDVLIQVIIIFYIRPIISVLADQYGSTIHPQVYFDYQIQVVCLNFHAFWHEECY